MTNAVAVAAGYGHSLALKADGTVAVWGLTNYGPAQVPDHVTHIVAIAAGAKPEQGLYTAIVAGLVVTLFGGSRVQIAGPTGAFAVLLAGVTGRYGLGGLQVVTMLAGLILVVFGLVRLGTVIKYIPESVVLGMGLALGGSIGVAFLAAVFISNLPEGIAGTVNLTAAGHSRRACPSLRGIDPAPWSARLRA